MPQIFDLHNDCLTSTKGKLSYVRYIKSLQQQPVMQVVQAIFTTEYTEPLPQIQKLYQTFCQHANTQTKHIAIEDFWFATKRNVPTILQYNPLYIGLTWNDTNRLAGGAFGQGGLTPWGEQVVKQIEQTSLVDTAHLNEKSFYAFANITQKPILCSHTALASFYKHPRNLTNAQIQTIVQSNGLVGLCFVSEFINGKKHCTVQDIAQEIDYCTLNNYYIYKGSEKNVLSYRIQVKDISDVKETISRMNVFLKNNKEIEEGKKFIKEKFNTINAFEMLDTDKNRGNKWISINPKEVDKFKTLKSLCSKLNIKVEEAIFFGDSTNDLPAISNVGLGVAMGNALEIVKKEAKEITLSNDEDGIAVFLEKICNTTKE